MLFVFDIIGSTAGGIIGVFILILYLCYVGLVMAIVKNAIVYGIFFALFNWVGIGEMISAIIAFVVWVIFTIIVIAIRKEEAAILRAARRIRGM